LGGANKTKNLEKCVLNFPSKKLRKLLLNITIFLLLYLYKKIHFLGKIFLRIWKINEKSETGSFFVKVCLKIEWVKTETSCLGHIWAPH
jgi:hypothetical protein